MILLIDNYDSFVFNLARYFRRLGQETFVVRNDVLTPREIRRLAPRAIVLSPGPGTPHQAGCSMDLVRQLGVNVPLLGVCLGHQAIGAAFGATVSRASVPMHGRVSTVTHKDSALFAEVPASFQVCRYHSLIIERATLPGKFHITAETTDGIVMAMEHAQRPIVGIQFHPEATLTEHGYQLLKNFLNLAAIPCRVNAFELAASEFRLPSLPRQVVPQVPVTF